MADKLSINSGIDKSGSSDNTLIEDQQASAAIEAGAETKDNNRVLSKEEKRLISEGPRLLYYPQTINTREQPHSVNFTFKVREQSAMGQTLTGSKRVEGPTEEGRVSAENLGGLVELGSVAGGLALGAYIARNGSAVGKIVAPVVGGITGVAAGKLATRTTFKENNLLVTQDIISLYVPQAPQASYGADYQDTSLGIAGAIGQGEKSLGNLMDGNIGDALSGDVGEFAVRQLVSAADIGKAIGLNVNIGGAIQAATKKVTNPFKEQLFKTMNFRDFAFEFKFAPVSQSELNHVMGIIERFKYHMHPEKSKDGLFLLYPSEVDIEFRYHDTGGATNKADRNTYVNRIATCALVNMKVDYGSGGVFTTLKGTKGAPSEVTMGLQFKELEILTKDRIAKGY